MSFTTRQVVVGFTLSIGLLSGCSESGTTTSELPVEPSPTLAAEEKPVTAVVAKELPQELSGAGAEADADASTGVQKVEPANFDPPFPNRVELFVPPSRPKVARAKSGGSDFELKGFVSVGGADRAVLSIDGRPVVLAAGESRDSLEVLVIDPPAVTLQRGRARWTESLAE